MNILEEIYHENIERKDYFRKSSEYESFVKIICSNEEEISAFLRAIPDASEQQHLFSQLMNAQSEINLIENEEYFIDGWKLGARFMLDTFLIPYDNV